MTSPVDTLKEMRDTLAGHAESMTGAALAGARNDLAALDAAIAALFGGEAEPFAWAPAGMADPRFAEQHFTVSRFQIAPDSIPLYTTPRAVPDGMVLVPREPTPEMIEAGVASIRCDCDPNHKPQRPTAYRAARNAYVSMLAVMAGDAGHAAAVGDALLYVMGEDDFIIRLGGRWYRARQQAMLTPDEFSALPGDGRAQAVYPNAVAGSA